MFKGTFAVLALCVSAVANAQISDVSGDLDVGPEPDYLQGTLCDDPATFFKIFDLAAQGFAVQSGPMQAQAKFIDQQVASGACLQLPPSSVWVVGLKTAKVSGSARKESLYVLARVRYKGRVGYTFPNYLKQVGPMLLRTARQYNEKNGRPIYQ